MASTFAFLGPLGSGRSGGLEIVVPTDASRGKGKGKRYADIGQLGGSIKVGDDPLPNLIMPILCVSEYTQCT